MTTAGYTYYGPNHLFLASAAILCFLFGANEIVQRLLIEVEGSIISSQTTTGNRPASIYLVLAPNGTQHQYIAGATDQSLPRQLPAGTHITKKKYELVWERDGKIVNDFPLYFYIGACGLGMMFAYWAFFQWRLNCPTSK